MGGDGKRRWRWRKGRVAFLGGLLAAGPLGLWAWAWFFGEETASRSPSPSAYAELAGATFRPSPPGPVRVPDLTWIPIPDFPGSNAIWGATGRDFAGHIWFGVSAIDRGPRAAPAPSARLFEFVPESGRLVDRGDVVTQLTRVGIAQAGERQSKIHSKIVPGEDGYLYFASMDEVSDEELRGSAFSPWGSHLWRLRPPDGRWEHLLAAPEGLIAVSGFGRYVYALGYPGHALYQFDSRTGTIRSVRVGAVRDHISRNFLTDSRGHAYVPRLRYTTETPSNLAVTLVEFDTRVREVGETALAHYGQHDPEGSHGIVAFQYLADRSIIFATHAGFLYRLKHGVQGPGRVTEEGWFHPEGASEVESMFSYDGRDEVVGAARRGREGEDHYEWVTFNLATRTASTRPLDGPAPPDETVFLAGLAGAAPLPRPEGLLGPAGQLLYGCNTRDDLGYFYLAGRYALPGRYWPALLRVGPAADAPRRARWIAAVRRASEGSLPLAPVVASAATTGGPPPRLEARGVPEPQPGTGRAEAEPAPGRPPAPPGRNPSHRREEFWAELRRLVGLPTARAASAIERLCSQHGREMPADVREAAARAIRDGGVRFNIALRVQLQRACGVPEPAILDDLRRLEAADRNVRGAARDPDAIVVRAARRLLAFSRSPSTRPTGALPSRPPSSSAPDIPSRPAMSPSRSP